MFEQLRQRNVHRVALAYLAGAWLLIQIVDTLTPDIFPGVVFRATVLLAVVGFVPALILAWVFEWTPEGIRREQALPAGTPAPKARWLDRAIVVTLLAAVTYFAVDKFVFDPVRDEKQIEAATAEALDNALSGRLVEEYRNRSVLVLPFENMSPDPAQQYFADGIAEELLNLLAQVEELRVISRSTAWTFKGSRIDVAEIHDTLDVSHILEGSVRKADDRVRITVQLIEARTNRHLWSDTYDRTLDDVFAIQDEVSARVVEALRIELLGGLPSASDIDPRAYDLYLRGRHLTHTVREPEHYDEAVEFLSRAVELEPDYVPAIWELARAILNASPAGTRSSQHPRIRELVDRLVELAPDSSYANGWLYFFAMEKRELQAAALFLERAIAGGRDANVHIMQGFAVRLLANMGRFDEAIALARYIVDRDPACTVCAQVLGFVLRQAGRPRETAQALQDLLEWREATPTWHWHMGVARLVSGDAAAALEHFEQTAPRQREFARLLALHDLERHAEFEAGFAKLRADPQRGPEAIARIAAWTGQNDLAFEYLERMVDAEGPESALWVSTDLYEPIKSDPRWRAFLERNDATGDEWSSIRFNPKLPAEVVKALATTD